MSKSPTAPMEGNLRYFSPAHLRTLLQEALSAVLEKARGQDGSLVGVECHEQLVRKVESLNLPADIKKFALDLLFQHTPTQAQPASTPNDGSGIVIKTKVGNIVGSDFSNVGNNYVGEMRLAQSTSGVSTPNHGGSRTEISTDVGNVVGSSASNIGNNYVNADISRLYPILPILLLFLLVLSILPGQ